MTFAWPASLTPQTVAWGLQKSAAQFRSPMAGSIESVEFPGQYWRISVTLPEYELALGSEGEAFFSRVCGGVERVWVPYWPRLVPKGTLRGNPVIATGAVRGDLQLVLATSTSIESLFAGDMIGVGSQLFQVFQNCIGSAGVLTVPLVNRVRAAITLGTSVVWSAPPATCLVPSLVSMAAYQPGSQNGIAVDLEEA